MKKVVFVCSQNRLRSPTAERVFGDLPGFRVVSAGTDRCAEVPLTPDLVKWADVLFVMEESHERLVQEGFRGHLEGKKVVCLDIPDQYDFMDPDLVNLLGEKLGDFFRSAGRPPARQRRRKS